MQKLLKPLIIIISILLGQSSTQAQHPDYSGTWILNLEKSKLEDVSDGFTGSIFIIEQREDVVKLTRYHLFGEKQNKIKFKMKPDGEARRVKLFFTGKLEWQGTNLISSLWRENFSNIVTYHFGANTNEFVADEIFKGAPCDHHNIWVFDRMIGAQVN